MYEYKAELVRVIDGDTYVFHIDLGFRIVMHDQRVRLFGLDTPERFRGDPEEREAGKAASEFVEAWFESHCPDGLCLIRTHKALTKTGAERKTFDRWLAEVFSLEEDGVTARYSLAESLSKSGHAK